MPEQSTQQETLVARLQKLEHFKEFGLKLGCISKADLERAQRYVLEDFYAGNPLARDVADGRTSYVELTRPVQSRFDTFKNRLFVGRKDSAFDEQVKGVLDSMNLVGKVTVDPAVYTTTRRVGFTEPLAMLGLIPFCTAAGAYASGNDTEGLIKAGMFGLTLTVVGGVGHFTDQYLGRSHLKALNTACRETDEFLAQYRL